MASKTSTRDSKRLPRLLLMSDQIWLQVIVLGVVNFLPTYATLNPIHVRDEEEIETARGGEVLLLSKQSCRDRSGR